MVTIGFRIDFYEKPARSAEERSTGLVGSVVIEDAYTAEAVPAVGESVSVLSLRVGPSDTTQTPLCFDNNHPFLPVREVQHHPVPHDADGAAGVIVVLHAELGYEGDRLTTFVRRYADAGWHWLPTGRDPELVRAVASLRS